MSRWPVVPLGEVIAGFEGGRNLAADADDAGNGGLAILKVSAVTTGTFNPKEAKPAPRGYVPPAHHFVRRGDLLISRANTKDLVGATAVVDREHHNLLLPDKIWRFIWREPSKVLPEFIHALFQIPATRKALAVLATGTSDSMRNISQSKLLAMPIVVPPVGEQRRIVSILDRANRIRRLRRDALDKAKSLIPALFAEMFGDPATNPKGSHTTRLGELADKFRYGTSERAGSRGVPVLRIPNVIGGEIDWSDLKYIDLEEAELARLALRHGDILFVRTNGNPDYVGRCAVFREPPPNLCGEVAYASYLIRCRLRSEVVLPDIVQAYLSSAYGRSQVREHARTSAGQYNINIDGLASLVIPIPPLASQREFARLLKSIMALKSQLEAHAARADTAQRELSQYLFDGNGAGC